MCQVDQECIALCLDGHPEVFRELVTRYQAALLAQVAGRVGDRGCAEEIVQESFVRAYFGLGNLRQTRSFFSWLLGIADRVTKEHLRDRQRQQEVARLWPERRSDTATEMSNDLGLERAVAELPEIYREVVLLRYYAGRSCAQLAEQLDIPLGTVTKRLSRAYGMLRESLARYGDEGKSSEVLP